MAGAVSAMGLLLGGILTTYASWRWVMFVNVPIGIVVAAATPRLLTESPRRPGRIDVAGAVTGTGGVALLVSFVLTERRSSHPLLPMRVLADRNRSGAYLIMLCIATGLFGLFFFLTLFIQTVLGYSAIRTGIAYLPFAVGVVIASALVSPLVARIGPRPLIIAGAAAVAGGMFWFSRLTGHAGYVGHLLGPQLVSSFGLGLVFVPLSLVALHKVAERDSGVASSLLNAGQQIGGAIGLALLGTVAWTSVADSVRTQLAHAAAAAGQAGRPLPTPGAPRLRSSTTTPWRTASPVGSLSPRGSRCSPCLSRSPPSGSAARTWPVPCPRRRRRHRNPRNRRPGLGAGLRTGPPWPRRPVPAGSASRHVITTKDTSVAWWQRRLPMPAVAVPPVAVPGGSCRCSAPTSSKWPGSLSLSW
jgi:MFS family permease